MTPFEDFTLIHGGMVILRLQSTCWLSSYLVDLRRKDRNPVGSLPLSLTLRTKTHRRVRIVGTKLLDGTESD